MLACCIMKWHVLDVPVAEDTFDDCLNRHSAMHVSVLDVFSEYVLDTYWLQLPRLDRIMLEKSEEGYGDMRSENKYLEDS